MSYPSSGAQYVHEPSASTGPLNRVQAPQDSSGLGGK